MALALAMPAWGLDAPADATPATASEGAPGNWSPDQAIDRLGSPVGVRFRGQSLQDVVRYLEHAGGVPIEPFWIEDHGTDAPAGLDPLTPIFLDARRLTCLEAIESVLLQAAQAQRIDQTVTWQFVYLAEPADAPLRVRAIEIGPAERLNHPTAIRAEVYDVSDLLAALAESDEPAPVETIRLSLMPGAPSLAFPVRRSETSPPVGDPEPDDGLTPRERELIELITTLVEPPQWVRNGGDAARIVVDSGALIVVAPDYIHRQIGGL